MVKKQNRLRSKEASEFYQDNPIPNTRIIMGIPKDDLCCRSCGEDATRFAVIKRKFHHTSGRSRVIECSVGFFCDECAGDVDELSIQGLPIE